MTDGMKFGLYGLLRGGVAPTPPHWLAGPGGRSTPGFTITPPGRIDLDTARRHAGLGVHRLVLQPGTEDGSDVDELIDLTGTTLIGRV